MVLKIFITFLLLFVIQSSIAQKNDLQSRINAATASSAFKYANLGVSVIDIASGKSIAGLNEHKVLIPASSQKVLTTYSALHYLTDSFQFETKLMYSGAISADGVLEGNIYIIGSGDPTLGSSKFEDGIPFETLLNKMAKEIKRSGIKKINGKIIGDESYFSAFPVSPSWQWNDLGNYYAAGAWGLNIHENLYSIDFSSKGTVGHRPKLIKHYPKVPNLELSNELSIDSVNTGDNAYIFGGPSNYYKRIVGSIPQGKARFTIKGSIPDPPIFAAYHLYRSLAKKGVESDGYYSIFDAKESRETKKNLIWSIKSPTLDKIVQRANLESNNLYCESLLKTIAKEKNLPGTGGHGINMINKYLRKLKINTRAVHLEDGSGLSARNNISPQALAQFMSKISQNNKLSKNIKYLAIGGKTGTLKTMFKSSSAAGHVFAKSGSMNRIQSYVGYIKCKSGRWVSFAVMINGYNEKYKFIRKKLEKIIRNIYLYG